METRGFERKLDIYSLEGREAQLWAEEANLSPEEIELLTKEANAYSKALRGEVLEKFTTATYSSVEETCDGLKGFIESQVVRPVCYVSLDTRYLSAKVIAGIVDHQTLLKEGVTKHKKSGNHLSLPSIQTCIFQRNQSPDPQYGLFESPIKLITTRKSFRPRVFIGDASEMKDLLTTPTTADTANSFRRFYEVITHGRVPEHDESLFRMVADIFNYFDYLEQERIS